MIDLFIITKTEWVGKIDESLPIQNVEFNGHMLEISKTDDGFKVTNAMDGWGDNIRSDYESAKLFTLDN